MDYDPSKFTDEFIRKTCDGLVANGSISSELAAVVAEEIAGWRNSKEKSIAATQSKIKHGKDLSFFVISGLTHLETTESKYNHEMINHIEIMLWNEFGFHHGSSALLTNENKLGIFPPEWKNPLTYCLDQRSVRNSDLIVGILSYPSQGLGQEAEHAKASGVPVVGILQRTKLSKKRLRYSTFSYEGNIEERILCKGRGGSSPMVIGNPAVHYALTYPRNTAWSDLMQILDNLGWRLQYAFSRGSLPYRLFKKAGKLLHPILEERNPRTIGLRALHASLCDFGFVPESSKVEKRLGELRAVAQEKLSNDEISELKEKEERLGRLLKLQNFHPLHRNNARMYYDSRFPLETRIPGGEGNHTKIVMSMFIKPKNGKPRNSPASSQGRQAGKIGA